MKRRYIAAALIAIILLLSGCRTVSDFSEEERDAALHEAGSLAVDSAFSTILASPASFDVIPQSAAPMVEASSYVPGLGYLIVKWQSLAQAMYQTSISYYPDYFKSLISALQFPATYAMLDSDTSVMDQLSQEKHDEIEQQILSRMEVDLDISAFDAALDLYNDYLLARSNIDQTPYVMLEIDPRPELSEALADFLLSEMRKAEAKVRTTPDLSLNSNFVKVFALGY
jgi:hypothetical protein